MEESFNETKLIVEHLKGKNNINVLDLGCGNGSSYIDCYLEMLDYSVVLDSGVIIDSFEDEKVLYSLDGYINKKDFLENWKDKLIDTFGKDQIGEKFSRKENVPKLIEKTKLECVEINKFLSNNKTQFDLIILSNVLHFIINEKERFELYDLVFKSLNKGGVFYIKVANDKHSYSEQEDKITFNKDLFLEEIEKTEFKLKSEVIYVENHLHILLTKDKKPCLKKLLKK